VLQFLPEMTRWTTMLPHCVENLNYPSLVWSSAVATASAQWCRRWSRSLYNPKHTRW
jgi:hypothetical protein